MITAVIGIPTIAYLIDPALRKDMSEGWIPVGSWRICLSALQLFLVTLVQVNGWERTSTSHGGYVLRKSEAPDDLLILNSRAPPGCTVNWSDADKVYLCPCHEPSSANKAWCLMDLHRGRWNSTRISRHGRRHPRDPLPGLEGNTASHDSC